MVVMNVVCVNIPHSFEEMIQWGGQASCDGKGGMLVVYVSKDLKRITLEEQKLDEYAPLNQQRHMLMVKQIECHNRLQEKLPRGLMDFFNPDDGKCPQVIVCHYFGDVLNKPLHCCDKCNQEILDTHLQKVNVYQVTP